MSATDLARDDDDDDDDDDDYNTVVYIVNNLNHVPYDLPIYNYRSLSIVS